MSYNIFTFAVRPNDDQIPSQGSGSTHSPRRFGKRFRGSVFTYVIVIEVLLA